MLKNELTSVISGISLIKVYLQREREFNVITNQITL
jgi:hypothetical protein